MTHQRTIYFGAPLGIYEEDRFYEFALLQVPTHLEDNGHPTPCNVERVKKDWVIYHYPNVGVGLKYELVNSHGHKRCLVDLIGDEAISCKIMAFLWERDSVPENR